MLIDIEVSAHNLKKSLDDVRDTFSSFVKLGGVVRAGYLFVWLVVIGICVKGIRWSRTGAWLTGSGLGESSPPTEDHQNSALLHMRRTLTSCCSLPGRLILGLQSLRYNR